MDFLIPANTKKSLLYFGLFNLFDLILFGGGIALSILLLLLLPVENLIVAVIAILPGLVTGFLVFPIPNYHNILTVIRNFILFFTTRQTFVWKGWCVTSEKADEADD